MSPPPVMVDRLALRVTRSTMALLAFAALAWAGSIVYARRMGNGSGSMGVAFAAFLAMWAAMMTAMMLPALAPVASEYTRNVTSRRATRVGLVVVGYLLVWTAVGIPVYAALRVVDHVIGHPDTTMRNIAVGLVIAAGLYQLSPPKSRSLGRCRASLPKLSREADVEDPWRELKTGLHYGVACVACSWALMALFIAFGVMNVWAMVALAAVILCERLLPRGEVVAQWAGAACLVLAVLLLASPRTADALVPGLKSTSNMTNSGM